ncbi:MAG: hypothetical protein N2C14_03675, partial [Planctomycetales bacterium]
FSMYFCNTCVYNASWRGPGVERYLRAAGFYPRIAVRDNVATGDTFYPGTGLEQAPIMGWPLPYGVFDYPVKSYSAKTSMPPRPTEYDIVFLPRTDRAAFLADLLFALLIIGAAVWASDLTHVRRGGFQFGIGDVFLVMFAAAVVLAMFQWFSPVAVVGFSCSAISLAWLSYSIWKRQPSAASSAVSSDGSNQG